MAGTIDVTWRDEPAGRLGQLRHAGRIEDGRGVDVQPYRRYDAYGVMYLYDGAGVYRDQHGEQSLAAGSLVCVFPGVPHWYGPVGGSGWNEVHVVFEGAVFETAHRTGVLDERRPVRSLLPVDYWLPHIDAFRTTRPPSTTARADEEACDLLRLLVDISDASGSPAGDWFDESRRFLGADLAAKLDLEAVAEAVGMRYETWRKQFQERGGVPPARFRLHKRIEAVRDLLRAGSMPNREIAELVGFSDEYHLSRQFRSVTGMTPTHYRRHASLER